MNNYDNNDLPERISPPYSGSSQPPVYDDYPSPYYRPAPQSQRDPSAGFGVASLVLGLISIFSVFFPFVPVVCSVSGIVLSIVSFQKSRQYGTEKPQTAFAGLICSIAAFIIHAASYLIFFGFFAWLSTQLPL